MPNNLLTGSTTGILLLNSYNINVDYSWSFPDAHGHLSIKGEFSMLKNQLNFFHVFFSQMIFMSSVFCYLVFLIFLNWIIYYNSATCLAYLTCLPRDEKSILTRDFRNRNVHVPRATHFTDITTQNDVRVCTVDDFANSLILRVRYQKLWMPNMEIEPEKLTAPLIGRNPRIYSSYKLVCHLKFLE